jgi:four helix bundle protein
MARACGVLMGARRVEELVVWQLANELRSKLNAIIAESTAHSDLRFCSQARDAVSSISRNIAEGFGRYGHRQFAHFLTIARGSVFEVADHLRDGVARRHWSEEQVDELHGLCNRTIAALTRLIAYLKTTNDH